MEEGVVTVWGGDATALFDIVFRGGGEVRMLYGESKCRAEQQASSHRGIQTRDKEEARGCNGGG